MSITISFKSSTIEIYAIFGLDDIPMILADDKKHALEKCMKELDQLRTNLDAILNAQDSNTA